MTKQIFEQQLVAGKTLYDAQVQYLDIISSEKKMKAKFTKQLLKGSDEGRKILELISNASNIKLLQ